MMVKCKEFDTKVRKLTKGSYGYISGCSFMIDNCHKNCLDGAKWGLVPYHVLTKEDDPPFDPGWNFDKDCYADLRDKKWSEMTNDDWERCRIFAHKSLLGMANVIAAIIRDSITGILQQKIQRADSQRLFGRKKFSQLPSSAEGAN